VSDNQLIPLVWSLSNCGEFELIGVSLSERNSIMKIQSIIATMFTFSIVLQGHYASAAIINFDDVADGTVIDNQYSRQGVIFSALPGKSKSNDGHVYARKDKYAKSQSNSVGLGNGGILPYANEAYGYINAHFTQLQGSVSVDVAAIMVSEFSTSATSPPYMAVYGAKDPTTGKNPLLQIVRYPKDLVKGLSTDKPGQWQTLTVNRPANDIQFVILSSSDVSPPAYGEFDNLIFSNTTPYVLVDPTIERQGETATLTVNAQGPDTLLYQWYKNGTPVRDRRGLTTPIKSSGYSGISGSTTAQLKIVNLGATDAGSYSVIVTNLAGSITSKPVKVDLLFPTPLRTPIRQKPIRLIP
jgi:hypothetical protein